MENKTKKKFKFIPFIIIFTALSLIYIFYLTPFMQKNRNILIFKYLDDLNKSCFLDCNNKICREFVRIGRGHKYFLWGKKEEQFEISSCILTFWGLSHIIFYFIVTYLLPQYYIEIFLISVLFEIVEFKLFTCHDIKDIFLNIIGIIFALLISPYKYN